MPTTEQAYNLLQKKVDEMAQAIQEIKTALVGNDLTTNRGIVHELEEYKQRLDRLEKKAEKAVAWLIGMGIGLGATGYKIVSEFLNK